MNGLIIVGVILLIGLVALVIYANNRKTDVTEEDILASRLVEFTERGEVGSLEEIEMSQPFFERVVLPILLKIGDISSRYTPQNLIEETERKIELAGNPSSPLVSGGASFFLASRFVMAVVFAGLAGAIFYLLPEGTLDVNPLLVILGGTVLGFFYPQSWLDGKIKARQSDVQKAMPDALDLLTICVEAGLGFDAAMSKVSEKWENELSLAFARAIREVQLGKVRREALKDMADRIDLPEMTSFVAAIIQSEQLGVSMARVLRIQSEQMRMKRRQRAEQEAHKAPVKMLLPMVFLTFPSIFIVLMTPAVIKVMNSGI
jgi:tight adherence protein C